MADTRLDYEREIEAHRRWNFTINVGDLSFYNLALALLFPSTILPLYASHLTSSAVLIGLIPAIHDVSIFLPQILMARHAETLARKKPFVVRASAMERLPYLAIGLAILLWPEAPAWLAYLVLAAGIGTARTWAGIASPGWRGMLAKIIHPDRRGTLFGTGYAFGGILGIGGAYAGRAILARTALPGLLRPVLHAGVRGSGAFVDVPHAEPRAGTRAGAGPAAFCRLPPRAARAPARHAEL